MALQSVLSSQEKAAVERWADGENKKLGQEFKRTTLPNQNLGKEDFLKLLLTQLAHQDPTAPMEDKQFIAQMAQFSSLEQISNMSAEFSKMTRLMRSGDAANALGRSVELKLENDTVEGEIIQGTVQAVTREETPMILVNGKYYEWDKVIKVYEQ